MRPSILVLGFLVFAASGCQRLDAPGAAPPGAPKTVTLDAIPSDLGELVAVTTAPQWPSNAQLWFVREDKSIAMIGVNMRTLRMSGTSVVIPRR